MAVTNLYNATASPAHTAPSIFSLRGLFSCCYGNRNNRGKDKKLENGKNGEHPFAESEDSDEEVREAFEGLIKKGNSFRKYDTMDLDSNQQPGSKSGSQGTRTAPGSQAGSQVSARPSQITGRESKASRHTGSILGADAASRHTASILGADAASTIKDEETTSDSSDHLSEDSSVTQYSEELGEAPQGLTNLSDISDETTLLNKEYGQVRPSGRVPTLGILSIGVSYEAKKARLKVRIREAKDIPDPAGGGTTSYQLHLVLLPEKRQRHKTKLRLATRLIFDESFVFTRVSPSSIVEQALRVRLYGCERMRRERLVAETVVALQTFGLHSDEKNFDIPLEPRTKLKSRKFVAELEPSSPAGSFRSDPPDSLPGTPSKTNAGSGSDSDSGLSIQGIVPHGNNLPEMLLGLSYNGTTGRLTVEVIKGSAFRLPGLSRPPDSYIKINLISANGQEVSRTKTSIRRNDPNPLFKETFMFQMAMFQLADLTLMIFVYHKKNISRKESIGWFSLGHNSSGEEEVLHWRDMREALGERVVRWHLLLEPS